MPTTNRKVVMKQLPVGVPTPADFEIVSESLGDIEDGQMLLRTRWLTLDPYLRSVFMPRPD
ncbi:MAG: NADP-dependent oxidoreductase, partial [Gammaproteobacteria bacterium]|nr:NADP-dependent oxidoreductase [Gammaproteobacteria bacterium]